MVCRAGGNASAKDQSAQGGGPSDSSPSRCSVVIRRGGTKTHSCQRRASTQPSATPALVRGPGLNGGPPARFDNDSVEVKDPLKPKEGLNGAPGSADRIQSRFRGISAWAI